MDFLIAVPLDRHQFPLKTTFVSFVTGPRYTLRQHTREDSGILLYNVRYKTLVHLEIAIIIIV